jgi:hypothetical protein
MSSVSSIGPAAPTPDPANANAKANALGPAIENYVHSLSQNDLDVIARQTVDLGKLASSVTHAASTAIRAAAGDLEKMLLAPVAVPGLSQHVSILTASQHYLESPATAELRPLIDELHKNEFAFQLMCGELHLLSGSIKNPTLPGN